jgi:hypothetical protein
MRITLGMLRVLIMEAIEEIALEPIRVTTVYHGTTKERANRIRESGFSMQLAGAKADRPLPGISTSTEIETAEEHAQWAAEKWGGEPSVLKISVRGLRIAPGSLYYSMWDEMGTSEAALDSIKASGGWDGLALFDSETGHGAEEMEVLLFSPPGPDDVW